MLWAWFLCYGYLGEDLLFLYYGPIKWISVNGLGTGFVIFVWPCVTRFMEQTVGVTGRWKHISNPDTCTHIDTAYISLFPAASWGREAGLEKWSSQHQKCWCKQQETWRIQAFILFCFWDIYEKAKSSLLTHNFKWISHHFCRQFWMLPTQFNLDRETTWFALVPWLNGLDV